MGYRKLSARPRHHAQAERAIENFKSFSSLLAAVARRQGIDPADIEIWFADEARIGQKNKITRRWAKRGTRPSAPQDQRTRSTYIFGALCPRQGKGAALILPPLQHGGDESAPRRDFAAPRCPSGQPPWHQAPMPCSSSTKPDGISRKSSHCRRTSPSSHCRPNARNSIRSTRRAASAKTSGSSCGGRRQRPQGGNTGSQTACSSPMPASSITAATHGTSLPTSHGPLCPSA